MLFAELERDDVVLGEKNRLCRHEATDDQVVFPLAIPLEVVEGPFGSLYLGDLVVQMIVEV